MKNHSSYGDSDTHTVSLGNLIMYGKVFEPYTIPSYI